MTARKMVQIASLVGFGLAISSMIYLWLLPHPLYVLHLAIFLSAIAGVYLGFSVIDGRVQTIAIEGTVMAAFIALAMVGLKYSLWILAVAYIAHGVWDCLHHPKLVTTKIAVWYPPFCAAYDWSLAAFIVAYMYL